MVCWWWCMLNTLVFFLILGWFSDDLMVSQTEILNFRKKPSANYILWIFHCHMREFLVRTWVGFARKSLGPLLQAVGHWIRDGTWNPFTSLFNRHVVCSRGLLHLVRQPCSWCPSQILWWQGTQRPSLWSDMIRLLWAMIRVWCECFFFPWGFEPLNARCFGRFFLFSCI